MLCSTSLTRICLIKARIGSIVSLICTCCRMNWFQGLKILCHLYLAKLKNHCTTKPEVLRDSLRTPSWNYYLTLIRTMSQMHIWQWLHDDSIHRRLIKCKDLRGFKSNKKVKQSKHNMGLRYSIVGFIWHVLLIILPLQDRRQCHSGTIPRNGQANKAGLNMATIEWLKQTGKSLFCRKQTVWTCLLACGSIYPTCRCRLSMLLWKPVSRIIQKLSKNGSM